jgi:hypothetical protein
LVVYFGDDEFIQRTSTATATYWTKRIKTNIEKTGDG